MTKNELIELVCELLPKPEFMGPSYPLTLAPATLAAALKDALTHYPVLVVTPAQVEAGIRIREMAPQVCNSLQESMNAGWLREAVAEELANIAEIHGCSVEAEG